MDDFASERVKLLSNGDELKSAKKRMRKWRARALVLFSMTAALVVTSSSAGAQQCQVPPRDCATNCGRLFPFEPVMGPGYETAHSQYRSYLRGDLMMLVKHAAAVVHCRAANWTPGNRKPIGLGDMSEKNGAIPGTSVGKPGHPAGTHTNGYEIDIAYYQLYGPNNHLHPVCPFDDYHCVGDPNNLDVWRTALFIGTLLTTDRTTVIGVDGKIAPLIIPALRQLCKGRWLHGLPCTKPGRIAFEVKNEKRGWFQFHHHHFHVSLRPTTRRAAAANSRRLAPGNRNVMKEIRRLSIDNVPGMARPEAR